MNRTLLTLILLGLFLLAIVSPFAALSGLMLIAALTIIYWMGLTIVRALVQGEVDPD
ncbi:MAG: hypothetical protein IGS50_24200 [Synechococcales cyanobacterium C42_A2020_086]|jgi:Sec-independent protein secretion pathway component TatC|nr:hypothetical protein [Synechococcales cyanobacterium M58_A2018_015]MBF2076842.1 hypothetical protein [Synechococcales cyanobacterium C42_A2020_086]